VWVTTGKALWAVVSLTRTTITWSSDSASRYDLCNLRQISAEPSAVVMSSARAIVFAGASCIGVETRRNARLWLLLNRSGDQAVETHRRGRGLEAQSKYEGPLSTVMAVGPSSLRRAGPAGERRSGAT
jgi:hypothetical protein